LLPELPGPAQPGPALEHAYCDEEELEQCQHGESRPDHLRIGLVRIGHEVLLQVNRTSVLKPGEHQDRYKRAAKKETGTEDFPAPCFEEPVSLACDVILPAAETGRIAKWGSNPYSMVVTVDANCR
jgi:hypothetical protein